MTMRTASSWPVRTVHITGLDQLALVACCNSYRGKYKRHKQNDVLVIEVWWLLLRLGVVEMGEVASLRAESSLVETSGTRH